MKKFSYLLCVLIVYSTHAEIAKPRVFVSVPPQKQFIEKIAGGHIEVQVMLTPGQSPETFSPTPKIIVSLSGASSYFQIGVPFEETWKDTISSVNPKLRIVSCCEEILSPDHSGENEDDELHIWTNPDRVKQLAKTILDELMYIDPTHKNEFNNNYLNFISELNVLDEEIRKKIADRRTDYFITSHAAWGEFAKRYGLVQVALEKNGKEIGPRSLLEIIRLANRENLRTVFVMQQYKTPFLKNLAIELDAEIVELDPLAEDYINNMYFVADRIARSLQVQ